MGNLISEPNSQNILYGYKSIFEKFIYLHKEDNLPNKILLSGPKGIGKATFAYHLSNFILSKNEDLNYDIKNFEIYSENKSFSLVKNNLHPNFFLVDVLEDKKYIDIDQIRKMINYSNKTTFNENIKIILIDNVEYLNKNSLNALLKVTEEPNQNTLFLLVYNNNKKLLDTLKSRCINFNFFLNFENSIDIANKILNKNILNFINFELINHYDTPGNLVNLYNFSLNENFDIRSMKLKEFLTYIFNNNFLKKNFFIKENIYKFVEFYLYKLMINNKNQNIDFIYSDFVKKIFDIKNFNLDPEIFFIEFRSKLLND